MHEGRVLGQRQMKFGGEFLSSFVLIYTGHSTEMSRIEQGSSESKSVALQTGLHSHLSEHTRLQYWYSHQ